MLQSVRLRDKNLSTILTIGILVIWATGLIIGITQKSDLNHMDFNFD